MTGVSILGGSQTDFARNWTREGLGLAQMLEQVCAQALDVTGLEPERVQAIHVGNFVGELFCGQGMLGGLVNRLYPAWHDLPASRHEAACASGSMAILAAMADIQAGHYDCVLVVGAELMRNVGGQRAAEFLGAAAWAGEEGQSATYLWPHMFDQVLNEYDRRYGVDMAHLTSIARVNLGNAKRNPLSQTRAWQLTDAHFAANDEFNPLIEGRLRRADCGQITDGAACLILASDAFAERYQRDYPAQPAPVPILGWGHRGGPMSLAEKLAISGDSPWVFPHLRATIQDALSRARLADANALDVIETHDCFTVSEYMAIDHFGLTPPGQSWQFIEEGALALDGRLPINPSGGLIGSGHPVGATGVRMLLDGFKQVRGLAGDYQVEGARRVATLNFGGSATATACFVVGEP